MALKAGILGLGNIGKIHLQNLLSRIDGMTCHAVYDPYVGQEYLDALPVSHKCRSEEAFWDIPDLDAVIICTPTPQHATQVERAIELGKHIFCEKPLAFDLATHSKIEQLLSGSQVKFQIGFNRRFDSQFASLRNMVLAGRFGALEFIHITSRDPRLPPMEYLRNSGGMFIDQTIHDFDMAEFIAGVAISEIFARGSCRFSQELHTIDDIDVALIQLKFSNGMLGAIDNSRVTDYGYDQRVQVWGKSGIAYNAHRTATNLVLSNADGITRDKPLYFYLERYQQSYGTELQEFVDAVVGNRSPAPSLAAAIRSLSNARAALRSLKSGKAEAV